jgi:hypothetical protein
MVPDACFVFAEGRRVGQEDACDFCASYEFVEGVLRLKFARAPKSGGDIASVVYHQKPPVLFNELATGSAVVVLLVSFRERGEVSIPKLVWRNVAREKLNGGRFAI